MKPNRMDGLFKPSFDDRGTLQGAGLKASPGYLTLKMSSSPLCMSHTALLETQGPRQARLPRHGAVQCTPGAWLPPRGLCSTLRGPGSCHRDCAAHSGGLAPATGAVQRTPGAWLLPRGLCSILRGPGEGIWSTLCPTTHQRWKSGELVSLWGCPANT